MDDGAVVEQGTHDYLLSVKGKYRDFWEAQTRKKGEGEVTIPVHSDTDSINTVYEDCCEWAEGQGGEGHDDCRRMHTE